MKTLNSRTSRRGSQGGATLIEILVSLFILMVGLLGLVGLMIESQRAHLESYQRLQALMLVQDMANRISANRKAAQCYVLTDYLGVDKTTIPDTAACASGSASEKAIAAVDLTEWRDLLAGSAEVSEGGDAIGAVLGARGCVSVDALTGVFQISVAWQGNSTGYAPPAGIPCASGLYGNEALRRAVSVTL